MSLWSWLKPLSNRFHGGQYQPVEGNSTTMKLDLGSRAVRRLVLIFFIVLVILGSLYTVKDKAILASSSSISDDVPIVPDVIEEQVQTIPHIDKPEEVEPSGSGERFPLIKNINPTSCEARRAEYKELVDGRILRNKVSRGADNELEGLSLELSQSQSIFSQTCWTSDDRYAHYTDPVDVALNKCNEIATPMNRTSVVLALEYNVLFTEDAILNLRSLILEVGWYYNWDVILLQNIPDHEKDEIDRIPEEFRELVVKYTNDDIFDGFPDATNAKNKINRNRLSYHGTFDRYTSTFYQFAQVAFFETFPEFEFAYFLESHVRNTGSYQELFGAIQGSTRSSRVPVDLLSLEPIVVTKPAVFWSGSEASKPESYYKAKHIVHGISRRLAVSMNESLYAGINAVHEAFLPAVALKHDYNIVMFAHPVMKRRNGLLFESYTTPAKQSFTVLNLDESKAELRYDEDGNGGGRAWQHGGTFDVNAAKWADDQKQTKWINDLYQDFKSNKETCLPGLLIYPVSGR